MNTSGTALIQGLREGGGLPERLEALGRSERLRTALNQAVPELAEGSLILEHLEARRIRIKGGSCSAGYELTVAEPDGERRALRLHGVAEPRPLLGPAEVTRGVGLGEQGWRCTIPELGLVLESVAADPALPALPILTDPSRARAILEGAVGSASPAYADIRIRACQPTVVRYKPGSRCTIVYRLDYAPGPGSGRWPNKVIAKTYWGDKGRHAYQAMQALWRSELGRSPVVAIAEPLAYLPELKVLIQGAVPGTTTLEFLVRQAVEAGDAEKFEALGDLMRRTARGLSALHSSNVNGEPTTWEDELDEVRQLVERLEPWAPGFGAGVEPLLARLEALGADQQQPGVPSHRSFRPAQVLVHRGRIGFIDFDGFCRAEPAMDLALFRATVKEVGMRGLTSRGSLSLADYPWLDQTDRLCQHFLDQYERLAPVSPERVELWEALYLLTKALHCWTKVRPDRLEGALVLLERHLRRSRVGFG